SISSIDSTLKIDETTQAQMRRHTTLVRFMDTHCQMRAYSFQAHPIPSKDHYTIFQQVYGTKTIEEYRPTYIQSKSLTNEEQQDYQQILESYSYSCGIPIFPDDYYLKEVIF
ncbi:13379_t:CDS:2, partial [Dentiscutata heterogama]